MKQNNFEVWRPVNGYENYAVSDRGRVKSLGNDRARKEKILKPALSGREGNRYLHVSLYKNGKKKSHYVHRLVALAFPEICGLPFEGADVNHIDENHFNNTPENLNWLSRKDNLNHGTHNERMAKAMKGKFINRSDQSKTVYQYTKSYELVGEYPSANEAQRQTGWSQGNISQCCNNRYNREGNNVYKNFIWSYTHL